MAADVKESEPKATSMFDLQTTQAFQRLLAGPSSVFGRIPKKVVTKQEWESKCDEMMSSLNIDGPHGRARCRRLHNGVWHIHESERPLSEPSVDGETFVPDVATPLFGWLVLVRRLTPPLNNRAELGRLRFMFRVLCLSLLAPDDTAFSNLSVDERECQERAAFNATDSDGVTAIIRSAVNTYAYEMLMSHRFADFTVKSASGVYAYQCLIESHQGTSRDAKSLIAILYTPEAILTKSMRPIDFLRAIHFGDLPLTLNALLKHFDSHCRRSLGPVSVWLSRSKFLHGESALQCAAAHSRDSDAPWDVLTGQFDADRDRCEDNSQLCADLQSVIDYSNDHAFSGSVDWFRFDALRAAINAKADHRGVWLVERMSDAALNRYDVGGRTALMRAVLNVHFLPNTIRALIKRAPAVELDARELLLPLSTDSKTPITQNATASSAFRSGATAQELVHEMLKFVECPKTAAKVLEELDVAVRVHCIERRAAVVLAVMNFLGHRNVGFPRELVALVCAYDSLPLPTK